MTMKVIYKKQGQSQLTDLSDKIKKSIREDDISTWPVIPTYLKSGDVEGFTWADAGYYGVHVNPKGIECLSPHAVKYEDFDVCKKACDIHNEFAGLSMIEMYILYAQRRFTNDKKN